MTAVLTTPPMTAAERCDRCGAQAYVRVLLASGGELLFCAHHGREHSAKLREVAAEIHDESARLPGARSAVERGARDAGRQHRSAAPRPLSP